MDDEELIERVSEFRLLYDKKSNDFKNKVKRENAWQTIAAIMGVTPIECDQRWTVLRNKYTTLRRLSKNKPSGSDSYTISWPYNELMKFLDPFIYQRKTTTNFSQSQSIPESSCMYSGAHYILQNTDESEEVTEVHDQSMEEDEDDTQALYENFIDNEKITSSIPPAKKIEYTEPSAPMSGKLNNPTRVKESQVLSTNRNLEEIKRLRSIKKQDDTYDKDGIVNKLGGCLSSFEKFITHKQTSDKEDEDFVKSLSKDLSVFSSAEKISLKRQFYECMDKKLREKET